jgi:hypothetical protein
VPLRALGLGAGLLGPTSSPLTLLGADLLGPNGGGGGGPKQTIRRRDAAGVASLPPTPQCHLWRKSCLQPLCPYPRGGSRGRGAGSSGGGAGSRAGRLGASGRRVRIWIPRWGSRPPV